MSDRPVELLIVVAGALRVGLPIASVRETMRPLKIEPLREGLPFVLGLAIVRGEATAVIDLGALLNATTSGRSIGRFVTLDVDARTVALAVESVESIESIESASFCQLPPLLARTDDNVIDALSLADTQLLLTLQMSRLIEPVAAGRMTLAPEDQNGPR